MIPCGLEVFGCRSVEIGLGRVSGVTGRIVNISGSVSLGVAQMVSVGSLIVNGRSSSDVMRMVGNGGPNNPSRGMITTSVVVTMNSVTFSLPSALGDRPSLF